MPTSDQKPSIRDLTLQEWTWRVGPEAAAHRIATSRWTIRTWFLGLLGFVLVLVGAKSGSTPTWLAGVAVYVVGVCSVVRTWVELVRSRRAISRTLGIPIKFRSNSPPPNRRSNYLAWCDKYRLSPYPFRPSNAVVKEAAHPVPQEGL